MIIPGSTVPLARAELALVVDSYSFELLDPPSDRHPEYVTLIRREQHLASADLPMLDLKFTKRPKQPRGTSAPPTFDFLHSQKPAFRRML